MLFIRKFLLLLTVLCAPVLQAAPTVSVSVGIEPMRFLVEQLGAERVQVTTLLSSGDPHAIDPTPAQLFALKRSDLYFAVGLPFEHGLGERLGDEKKLIWLDQSSGESQPAHKSAGSDHDDADHVDADHDASDPHESEYDEEGEHAHAHAHSDELGRDPHRWTSPAEMLSMAKDVVVALTAADPEGEAHYQQRLQQFAQRVDTLQADIRQLLENSATAMAADHPAWGWFCAEFSLQQLSVEHEGKLPSIRRMSELKKEIQRSGARFVVSEQGGAQAQALAANLGLRLLVANALSYEWEETLRELAKGLSQP